MYKELIVSIVILIAIFTGDYITQNYTDKTVSETIEGLKALKDNMAVSEITSDEKLEKGNEVYEKWLEKHEILAYFIEHDELEKVETEFVACKSFIASEQYELADAELEKTMFILEHINDKYSFSLENIF